MTTNIYDPALRLSQVIDSYATTVYQYDANGRLIETDDNANGAEKTTRGYDSLKRAGSAPAAFARTILLSPSTALTRLLICLMAAFLYVKSQ
jgi:YD repeat-containing protein